MSVTLCLERSSLVRINLSFSLLLGSCQLASEVSNDVGNPLLQLHLVISNGGGRNIQIKSITLIVERDNQQISSLQAQSYLQLPSDDNAILLTPFRIKLVEEWGHSINFFAHLSREEEKQLREHRSALRNNILSKRVGKSESEIVEADDGYIKPLTDFFDNKFVWKPGEYRLHLSISADPGSANVSRSYRFTLFESDRDTLTQHVDGYKYGEGIYFPSSNYIGINLGIKED